MRFIQRIRMPGLLSFPPDMDFFDLQSLNVLIGPNGSGKSNFIETLELLRAIADGFRRRHAGWWRRNGMALEGQGPEGAGRDRHCAWGGDANRTAVDAQAHVHRREEPRVNMVDEAIEAVSEPSGLASRTRVLTTTRFQQWSSGDQHVFVQGRLGRRYRVERKTACDDRSGSRPIGSRAKRKDPDLYPEVTLGG